MTQAQITTIKSRISNILENSLAISAAQSSMLLPISALQGKLYEASVLAEICHRLNVDEGFNLRLINNNSVMLKQKGGPVNRDYPYIEVYSSGLLVAELWTDIEFTTMSHNINGSNRILTRQDYHELDIALTFPNISERPSFEQIYMAVECKNTKIEKRIIREILGYRRELSFLSNNERTFFSNFPTNLVPSSPSSVHMFYCSDRNVLHYYNNCKIFGTFLIHHTM